MIKPFPLSTIALLFSLGVMAPAEAQSERHPTDAEIQQLVEEMRQRIPQLESTGIHLDRRTPEERQEQEDFAAAWAEADPAIAPYLGSWTAIEETLMIYPSASRGEVCIVDMYLEDVDFYRGQVVDGKVYTERNLVFVLDSDFLGSTSVYDNQPRLYEYSHPGPVTHPSAINYFSGYFSQNNLGLVTQFDEAGCLAEFPPRYPTETEIQQLIDEMRQTISEWQSMDYFQDKRTPEVQQEHAAFAAAWAEVDPAIAPFLGDWGADLQSVMIYPSPNRGEVCIVSVPYVEHAELYMGRVINGKLYTNDSQVYVLDGDFLGNAYVYNNQPGISAFSHPLPLEDPVTSDDFEEYYPGFAPQFTEAGCIGGLP
ncbi:MAG: hypothetical protein AAF215_19460 [Cyanobacteria bacterium P01_A01_bin.123]